MKKGLTYLLFIFIELWTSLCYSQNPTIDSILNLINTTKLDSVKIDSYNNLFFEYEFSDDKKADTRSQENRT